MLTPFGPCLRRADLIHPPFKTSQKKSAEQLRRERPTGRTHCNDFWVVLFRLNGAGRAGEGEGNCGNVPTEKHCPSWVVAKFKARSCNPHTATTSLPLPPRLCSSQRLPGRYHFIADHLLAHDRDTSSLFLVDLFLPFLQISSMHRSSPAQSARGTPRRARTALADAATPLASPLGSPVGPKPPKTFISSLEIPVQGAVPIPQPPGSAKSTPFSSAVAPAPPTPTASSSTSTTATQSGRRAPRRSKTEALAALQNAVHADGADDGPPPGPTLFHPDAAPLPAAPRLDMGTVRTPSRGRRVSASPQAPQKERPFGLQDCPAFYPTPEEFRDPMSYIRSISTQAQEYGIAKIVPPETWRMPFVTDTEVSEVFEKKNHEASEEGGRERWAHGLFFLEIQVHDAVAVPQFDRGCVSCKDQFLGATVQVPSATG